MLEEQQKYFFPPMEEKPEAAEIGIIRELSSKKVLENVRMKLKGYEWNPIKAEYEKIVGMEPLMNDAGISRFLNILSCVVNDLITFGNYKEEEINALVQYVCDNTIPAIHINYAEYGIKNKSDLFYLDTQVFTSSYGAFKKAMGAGDRNVIRGTVSEGILRREMQMPQNMNMIPQKQSFLSNLNPFRRNV